MSGALAAGAPHRPARRWRFISRGFQKRRRGCRNAGAAAGFAPPARTFRKCAAVPAKMQRLGSAGETARRLHDHEVVNHNCQLGETAVKNVEFAEQNEAIVKFGHGRAVREIWLLMAAAPLLVQRTARRLRRLPQLCRSTGKYLPHREVML